MKIIKHTDNSYFIDKQYLGYKECRIDGKIIEDITEVTPLQFNHLPVVEKVIRSSPIDYYQNEKGERLEFKDFEEQKKALYKADDDGNWDDIDAEFIYKKFRVVWIAVRKDEIIFVPITPTILYANVKSEFDDIVPIYTIEEQVEVELFMWNPDFQKYVRNVAEKYKFVDAGFDVGYEQTKGRKYSFSRKNSIEYMTANDSYASEIYDSRSFKNGVRKGSYEELVKQRQACIDTLDSFFSRESDKTNSSKLGNVGVVISKLENIKSLVNKIDQKASSKVGKYTVSKQITDLIEELSHL